MLRFLKLFICLIVLVNIYFLSQRVALNSTRKALISELVLNERLESLSLVDPLTQLLNRRALNVFSRSFPLEYPEIEALVVLQRRRFRFEEVPCKFRPRTTGRSSITRLKSLYYIVHVLLGVFVNVLKFEGRRRKK